MRRLLLCLALAGLLSACGDDAPKDPLVGTWSGDLGGLSLVLILGADGKLEMKNGEALLGDGTWSAKDGRLTLDLVRASGGKQLLTCDYVIKDGVLRLSGEAKDCTQAPNLTQDS